MKKVLLTAILVLGITGFVLAQTGVKMKRPLPYDYGKAVLNNYSEKAGLAPVVFDHWLHRSKYTCRLCHVDIAFAMKTGTTDAKATDNANGYYCGTCHNGRTVSQGKRVFESCSKKLSAADTKYCSRCHSLGKNIPREYDFAKFTGRFPRERFGNGINWEMAEADGHIKLVDFLEGVSMVRKSLSAQKDFALGPTLEGMPEIIFSHKKHTVWNGCELCHPEIFMGVKKGATKYTMVEIFEGRYCGVCHRTVAFPLIDCQRCHMKPVKG
jgi:c(7)-type cytochrome triheme protein